MARNRAPGAVTPGCPVVVAACLTICWLAGVAGTCGVGAAAASVPNPVLATVEYAGQLIVAGSPASSGGGDSPYVYEQRVVAWDGSAWRDLPFGGLYFLDSGAVTCLAVFNGELYCGGEFAGHVARWDGARWLVVGGGVDDDVLTLIVRDGTLVAGGIFLHAGGGLAPRIARWDGAAWSSFGIGTSGDVCALCLHDGDLVAGGRFRTAGGLIVNNIARWTGESAWVGMAGGVADSVFGIANVRSLAVHDGRLIVGGYFTHAGGVAAANLAVWDGDAWSTLGTGFDNAVLALAEYEGGLYAAGQFAFAGEVAVNHVATWTGSAWAGCGSGIVGSPRNAAPFGGALVFGGSFSLAGGLPAENIARWQDGEWSVFPSVVPVALTGFAARRVGDGAAVSWTFARYPDLAGCHLWREEPARERVRLTRELIGAQAAGAFIDRAPPAGPADYWLQAVATDGAQEWYGPARLAALIVPESLRLAQNRPNPFNPRTSFHFSLPQAGRVVLAIHDLRGARVATLVDADLSAGELDAAWDGRDDDGAPLPSGIYLARLLVPGGVRTVKVTLAR